MGLNFACSVLVLKPSEVSLGLSSGLEEVSALTLPTILEAQLVRPVAGRAGWRMSRVLLVPPWWLGSVMVATTA